MKWKKEHKMASMNAMPMHQMHPALAYGHHPMVSRLKIHKVQLYGFKLELDDYKILFRTFLHI